MDAIAVTQAPVDLGCISSDRMAIFGERQGCAVPTNGPLYSMLLSSRVGNEQESGARYDYGDQCSDVPSPSTIPEVEDDAFAEGERIRLLTPYYPTLATLLSLQPQTKMRHHPSWPYSYSFTMACPHPTILPI